MDRSTGRWAIGEVRRHSDHRSQPDPRSATRERESVDRVYYPTAALVVEIVLPEDKSWDKLAFYAEHNVDEVLIVDPHQRRVHWLGPAENGQCTAVERSG